MLGFIRFGMLTIIHLSALGVVTVFVAALGVSLLECSIARIVSHGVSRLLLASFKFWSRRCADRRRDARVGFAKSCPLASRGSPELIWRFLPSWRLASVFQRLVRWHPEVHLFQIWRLVGRHDARRRLSDVSNGIPKLPMLIIVSFGYVGFLASFTMSSGGSPALNLASFGGVATLGVGFQHRVLWHSWAHLRKRWHLGSASQLLSSGLSSLVRMCHVCHPEGQVLLNIIEKIIPKPKIFTETRTQDSSRVCDLSSCNLLSESNKICLGAALLYAWFWSYMKLPRQDSNPGQFSVSWRLFL
jgi:hypothetical protein